MTGSRAGVDNVQLIAPQYTDRYAGPMASAASSEGTAAGRPRRLWRIAGRVVLVLVLIPLVLVPVYWIVPPISTLMIYDRLFGPVERTWVALDDMAPSLPASVVMSEDGKFCEHWGVDWEELTKVIDRRNGPNRGASTVTMQVVKNLFLWNSRSYIRKGLEIPLALYADLVWSKRRTMEIYLNIVEWGPGTFGAEAAAQRYFKRSAKALTPQQSALLVAALPNPIDRNPAKPSRFMRIRAKVIASQAKAAGAYINCLGR
jgi:monofunctional biosynthetic peptidoglycan transglycosylase